MIEKANVYNLVPKSLCLQFSSIKLYWITFCCSGKNNFNCFLLSSFFTIICTFHWLPWSYRVVLMIFQWCLDIWKRSTVTQYQNKKLLHLVVFFIAEIKKAFWWWFKWKMILFFCRSSYCFSDSGTMLVNVTIMIFLITFFSKIVKSFLRLKITQV